MRFSNKKQSVPANTKTRKSKLKCLRSIAYEIVCEMLVLYTCIYGSHDKNMQKTMKIANKHKRNEREKDGTSTFRIENENNATKQYESRNCFICDISMRAVHLYRVQPCLSFLYSVFYVFAIFSRSTLLYYSELILFSK